MACFFPEGFDADPDIVDMKVQCTVCPLCMYCIDILEFSLRQKRSQIILRSLYHLHDLSFREI